MCCSGFITDAECVHHFNERCPAARQVSISTKRLFAELNQLLEQFSFDPLIVGPSRIDCVHPPYPEERELAFLRHLRSIMVPRPSVDHIQQVRVGIIDIDLGPLGAVAGGVSHEVLVRRAMERGFFEQCSHRDRSLQLDCRLFYVPNRDAFALWETISSAAEDGCRLIVAAVGCAPAGETNSFLRPRRTSRSTSRSISRSYYPAIVVAAVGNDRPANPMYLEYRRHRLKTARDEATQNGRLDDAAHFNNELEAISARTRACNQPMPNDVPFRFPAVERGVIAVGGTTFDNVPLESSNMQRQPPVETHLDTAYMDTFSVGEVLLPKTLDDREPDWLHCSGSCVAAAMLVGAMAFHLGPQPTEEALRAQEQDIQDIFHRMGTAVSYANNQRWVQFPVR